MTIHYHGTPITPRNALLTLRGKCFCVSYAAPQDIEVCTRIGQSVMIDNGAFSRWTSGNSVSLASWNDYYTFCERWLTSSGWAVIPDVIDGRVEDNDVLIDQWPLSRYQGAPVWHMNDTITRLTRLLAEWPRVCVGSTHVYARVMSSDWQRRMDMAFDAVLVSMPRSMPNLHMLRGMACAGKRWPFASIDSTDVARNHKRYPNMTREVADPRGMRYNVRRVGLALLQPF